LFTRFGYGSTVDGGGRGWAGRPPATYRGGAEMTTKGDELQRLYEWAGNLAEELEELQDAIFDLAEGEDDDGGPVPERCGGGRRYYPAMTLDEGEPYQ